MSKMGLYQVGRKWLSENRVITVIESPESKLDKAIEKHISDEAFVGNEVKLRSLRKAFVADRDLDAAAKIDGI